MNTIQPSPPQPALTAERLEEEASRAAFEDWTGHSKPPERMDDGQYYSKPLQSDWRLWQGAVEYARESLAAQSQQWQPIEEDREAFERWAKSDCLILTRFEDGYYSPTTNKYWVIWKASRTAIDAPSPSPTERTTDHE